ncbi:MAG: DUF4331 family protein [Gemmatimonadaceae bacterium]|nr:DUF4331 family protein [Gemmatimonadaceae bacterium]
MLEKNSANAARWMRAATALITVTGSVLLVACSDTTKANTTEPANTTVTDGTSEIALDARMDDDERNGETRYEQVEFLGNPLVSEVTIVKANHDRYNRTQPYNSAEFGAQSLAFINAFRGNQPEVANTLGAVLYPDMLIVESSRNPATSGWLSWALANGWGGRNLKDDVVDAGLSAIFGKVVSPNGAYCENGQLPLCTDNVPANDKAFSTRFPYLASPTY